MCPSYGGPRPAGAGFGFPGAGAPPPVVEFVDSIPYDAQQPSSETFKGICTEFFSSRNPFPNSQTVPASSRTAISQAFRGAPSTLTAMVALERPLYMAAESSFLWPVGATITVGFVSGRWGGTPTMRAKVEQYAKQWMTYANIKFVFVQGSDADVRVAFDKNDGGSWSFVGRDCLSRPRHEHTMNFGWFNNNTREDEFSRVILHEFGHVLGCVHEHSAPLSPFQWNRRLVIAYYEQQQLQDYLKQGYTVVQARQEVRTWVEHNIFEKYSKEQTQFSQFDPESIMLYPFESWMTTNGLSSGWNLFLSPTDKSFISFLYPFNTIQPPSPPKDLPTQPRVQSYRTTLRGKERMSGLYDPSFRYQTDGRNPAQLPCLGVTALELAPHVNEVLIRSQALIAGDKYALNLQCWRSFTSVESVQFDWLELPWGYPDVQFGTYNQTVNIRDATVAAQECGYRVNFSPPFSSQPKVAVFLGQFYVDKARNYRWEIRADSIDRWGFTLKVQSSGANPDVMTNFVVNWIAHPADSPWVESGTFSKVFNNERTGSGTITFDRRDWTRTPAVFMGISQLELWNQQQLKIDLSAQGANSRSVQWYFELGNTCFFGAATGQYIAFA